MRPVKTNIRISAFLLSIPILVAVGYLLVVAFNNPAEDKAPVTSPAPATTSPPTGSPTPTEPANQTQAEPPPDMEPSSNPDRQAVTTPPALPTVPAAIIETPSEVEQIPTSTPSSTSKINLVQNSDVVTASGQNLTNFAYFITDAEPNCDDDRQTGDFTAGQIASGLQNKQWVCFRAQDSANNYAYRSMQVNLTSPTVDISQFKDKIKVVASVAGLKGVFVLEDTWQKFITSAETEPDCDNEDFQTSNQSTQGKEIAIDKTDNNRWVCYRVSNSLGVYGYDKYQLDYNAPTITISVSKDGKTLTASTAADDLPENPQWRKSGPNDSSGCNANTSFTAGNVINNIVVNKYYCFSVADKAGNEDYAEFFTEQRTSAPPGPPRPAISLVQDNQVIKINQSNSQNLSSATLSYFTDTSNPDCSPSNTNASYTTYDLTNNAGVGGLNNNNWVCFRAALGSQVVYVKIQINLTKPSFTLTQDNDLIKITDTANISDFSYFEDISEPPNVGATSCSDDRTTGWISDSDGSVSGIADNQWICFRAKNSLNVYGYAKLEVDLTKPSFSLSQDKTTVAMSTTTKSIWYWLL